MQMLLDTFIKQKDYKNEKINFITHDGCYCIFILQKIG